MSISWQESSLGTVRTCSNGKQMETTRPWLTSCSKTDKKHLSLFEVTKKPWIVFSECRLSTLLDSSSPRVGVECCHHRWTHLLRGLWRSARCHRCRCRDRGVEAQVKTQRSHVPLLHVSSPLSRFASNHDSTVGHQTLTIWNSNYSIIEVADTINSQCIIEIPVHDVRFYSDL